MIILLASASYSAPVFFLFANNLDANLPNFPPAPPPPSPAAPAPSVVVPRGLLLLDFEFEENLSGMITCSTARAKAGFWAEGGSTASIRVCARAFDCWTCCDGAELDFSDPGGASDVEE